MLSSAKSLFLSRTAFHHLTHRGLYTPLMLQAKRRIHTTQPTIYELHGKLRQCIENLQSIEAGLSQTRIPVVEKGQGCQSLSPEQYQDYFFGRVKEPPPGMCKHAIDLCECRNSELMVSQEKMLEYGDYTLPGALIHIAYYARVHERVSPNCKGVEEELNELASQEEFVSAFHKEAHARGLVAEEVCNCVGKLIKAVLKTPRDPGYEIVIKAGKYTANQVAALAAILKVQEKWPVPLPWREEVSVSK